MERCCATGCCPVSDIDASDQTPNTMNLSTFESKNLTIGLIVGIFGFVILALMLIYVFCRIRKPAYRQTLPQSSPSETFSNKKYLTDVYPNFFILFFQLLCSLFNFYLFFIRLFIINALNSLNFVL